MPLDIPKRIDASDPLDPGLINPPSPEEVKALEASDIESKHLPEVVSLNAVAGFSIDDIKTCAALSYLSYNSALPPSMAENYKSEEAFKEAGYQLQYIDHPKSGTRCVLAIKGSDVVIAFRGTSNLKNIKTDLSMALKSSSFMTGRVHGGFYEAFKQIWPSIREAIDAYATTIGQDRSDMNFTITGHSMGGAMAKIASWYMYQELCISSSNIRTLTLGDPRVFGSDQAAEYDAALGPNTLRIRQPGKDLVPVALLGSFGYKHVGAQIHVDLPPPYKPHLLTGYCAGIDKMGESMVPAKSVTNFYSPSRLFQKLNENTLGKIQSVWSKARRSSGKQGVWALEQQKAAGITQPRPSKPGIIR